MTKIMGKGILKPNPHLCNNAVSVSISSIVQNPSENAALFFAVVVCASILLCHSTAEFNKNVKNQYDSAISL